MQTLSHRERISITLEHGEADRVPIDLGGMDASGISAAVYNRLKQHLGINGIVTKIIHPYQCLSEVDSAVRERFGIDVIPVVFEPQKWREDTLLDGTVAQLPVLWRPVSEPDSAEVVHDSGGNIVARKAQGSWSFEPWGTPLADINNVQELNQYIKNRDIGDAYFYADETWNEMEARARRKFIETNYATVGNFGATIFAGAARLQGFETFMMNLIQRPSLAEAIMDMLADRYIQQFDRYADAVGPYVQVITVADDLGTQQTTMISPKLYRERVKPFQKKLYDFIHKRWEGKLLLHSDGAISQLIPDLIEIGVDILNPIQSTATGMDLVSLKRDFGRDLCFWGGGCDTQHVLPHGSVNDVRDDVKRRLDLLMPGGGFVFSQIHNILPEVPEQNVVAMLDTVLDYGQY